MNRALASAALTLLVMVSLGLSACAQSGSDTTTTTVSADTTTTSGTMATTTTSGTAETTFALEELAQYDGKDGSPAYVAVDGVVYDVTGSRMWPEGAHARCDLGAAAGQDLSELINKAPANMRELLSKMPVVGRLAQ